ADVVRPADEPESRAGPRRAARVRPAGAVPDERGGLKSPARFPGGESPGPQSRPVLPRRDGSAGEVPALRSAVAGVAPRVEDILSGNLRSCRRSLKLGGVHDGSRVAGQHRVETNVAIRARES